MLLRGLVWLWGARPTAMLAACAVWLVTLVGVPSGVLAGPETSAVAPLAAEFAAPGGDSAARVEATAASSDRGGSSSRDGSSGGDDSGPLAEDLEDEDPEGNAPQLLLTADHRGAVAVAPASTPYGRTASTGCARSLERPPRR